MKLPKGRKAIIVLGLPVGLALGGALAYTQLAAGSAPRETPDPSPGQQGVMLALEERVINLQSGGAYRYAKIGITVELRPETADFYALAGEVRAKTEATLVADRAAEIPILLDTIGSVVASRTSDDMTKLDGRASLKAELLAAIREDLGERTVLDVYFTDLVLQ